MPIPSLIMDLTALFLIVFCAMYYAKRGFVVGLVSFLGTLCSLLLAFFGSQNFAAPLFNSYFAPGLIKGVKAAVEEQGVADLAQMINEALKFLPKSIRNAVLQNLNFKPSEVSPAEVAAQMVENVVKPIVVPFLQIVLFFIILSMSRLLFLSIRRLLTGMSRLPGISTINSAVGAVMGVLVAALYCYILLCAIWGYNVLNPVNVYGDGVFSKSFVWEWLSPFNFFAKL